MPRTLLVGLVSLLSLALLSACAAPPAAPPTTAAPTDPPFDLLITGGRVVDGTGAPWIAADVGIRGDRIAAIGQLSTHAATRRIEAAGHVVAPGFISAHSHLFMSPLRGLGHDVTLYGQCARCAAA